MDDTAKADRRRRARKRCFVPGSRKDRRGSQLKTSSRCSASGFNSHRCIICRPTMGSSGPAHLAAGKLPADIPADFGYVTDAAYKKAQKRLAKLVPNEKHITNTNSGHEIHKEQPQLVIDAIREVVEAVRSGKR